MIQYACNLSCIGCITMTDYKRKGSVDISKGTKWLTDWSEKLEVGTICLFGGEPLLNKDLSLWIGAVRKFFPTTTIKIISNGSYLTHVDILPKLFNAGNAVYQISLHWREGQHYNNIKTNLLDQLSSYSGWKPVTTNRKEVILAFKNQSVTVQLAVFGDFIKPYNGYGKTMKPWLSDDISLSYSNCGSPQNPILYKNKIYKCGPIANLRDTLGLHNLLDDDDWQEYLKYTGYSIDDNLAELVDNFDKPNAICSMCSKNKDTAKIDHYATNAVLEKREIKWVN
jgi:hypothetical protein